MNGVAPPKLVPPLAVGNVPVTPVVKGKPVALVNVPDVGVPRMGVTKVGLLPNDVRLEDVIPEPRVDPLSTLVPFIFKTLPVNRLRSSEDVHADVAETQLNVLSVAPLRVIPPLSAVISDGVATEPNSIFLSSTVKVVEFIVVVVPLTVRSPLIVILAAATVPVKVGEAENTKLPVPVSSLIKVAS